MPLLSYASALPLGLWDLLHSPFRAMNGLVLYLTAFLTSTSVFSGNSVEGVAGQYLLGLGESFMTVFVSRALNGSFEGIGDITGYVHSVRAKTG